MSIVQEAIRQWETARAGVIGELENIPEERLDHRPSEGARSVREIALHIAESGVAIAAELLRPDGSFARLFDPQVQAQIRASLPAANTRAEVLELLRVTGEQGADALRVAGESLATTTMQTLGGQQTRLTGLWFGVAHEMYHTGQIALNARLMGQVPALTQRIAAMTAR